MISTLDPNMRALIHFIASLLTVFSSFIIPELRASDSAREHPLIGLWSLVSEEQSGQQVHVAADGTEYEFRADGAMIVSCQIRWVQKIQHMRYSFTVSPPNVLLSIWDGKDYEKQQFTLNGTTLTLEGPRKRKSTLRKISQTELIEAPLSSQNVGSNPQSQSEPTPSNKGRKPSDSAAETARNVYLVLNDGTTEEMRSFYTKNYSQMLGELPAENQRLMAFEAQSNLVTLGHAIIDVEVIDVAYPDFGASVKIRLHYKSGGTRVYSADFKKEDGVWKLLYY